MPGSNTVVMKFGGTSVADPDKIRRAAAIAVAERRRGRRVAVVVSAPGTMTDELWALAHRVSRRPGGRELDQLLATGEQVAIALFSMAAESQGARAISLTGAQAGIRVGGEPGRARILSIDASAVRRELSRGRIAVVAGFQGANSRGETMTLGRGGSDLTAVALAFFNDTATTEIYTDVKGVYTADPRIVSEARKLSRVGFSEMIELAAAGAQVMQPRSIELARRRGVRIHVRSAFHPGPGTWIVPSGEARGGRGVAALALGKNGARSAARIAAVGSGLSRRRWARDLMKRTLVARKIAARFGVGTDRFVWCSLQAAKGEAALRHLHRAFGLEQGK